MIELIDLKKNNLINLRKLVEFYKKGFFPMADSRHAKTITFFKPLKRFIIPINNFHVPKKLFSFFKKQEYCEIEKMSETSENGKTTWDFFWSVSWRFYT